MISADRLEEIRQWAWSLDTDREPLRSDLLHLIDNYISPEQGFDAQRRVKDLKDKLEASEKLAEDNWKKACEYGDLTRENVAVIELLQKALESANEENKSLNRDVARLHAESQRKQAIIEGLNAEKEQRKTVIAHEPGDKVKLSNGAEATVLEVHIAGGSRVSYTVAWWSGVGAFSTRQVDVVDAAWEISDIDMVDIPHDHLKPPSNLEAWWNNAAVPSRPAEEAGQQGPESGLRPEAGPNP